MDQVKKMEHEDMLFTGYGGKVTFDMFDKHIGRYMRLRYGRRIGEGLWMDNLPLIEGEQQISDEEFLIHCDEVADAITMTNPSRAKHLYDEESPFWKRSWHIKWRDEELGRMFDIVSMKCRGQAALSMEELGMENARYTRKHLKKEFGGASEDVKFRERMFELGMPKKKGAHPFPRGVNIEAKLRQLRAECTKLKELCPKEERDNYEFGKESTLVKIIMEHLQHTEYEKVVKELLFEIKMDRKLQRATSNAGSGVNEVEEDHMEDWEYRNYKDGWLPSFARLRAKLVSHYKELKYHQGAGHDELPSGKRLPAMFAKTLMENVVSAMYAPGFGQRPKSERNPKSSKVNTGKESLCWACNKPGHRRGDPRCTKDSSYTHPNAPSRANKRKRENDGGPKVRKPDGICRFYRDSGTCKFGANCKFTHDKNNGSLKKHSKPGSKKEVGVKAMKAQVQDVEHAGLNNEIDDLVKGFLFTRTIPRERVHQKETVTAALKTSLVDDTVFAYDTGSGEGISTRKDDFAYLDTSDKQRNSVKILGPSVGSPKCLGRGPLVYMFMVNGRHMALIHPNGILAGAPRGSPEFRLASAIQLKKRGVRYLGGKFNEDDVIECVRSGFRFHASDNDGILIVETAGVASDIEVSEEFKMLVKDIDCGLSSPLIEITPYLKGCYAPEGESNRKYAVMEPEHPLKLFLTKVKESQKWAKAFYMNEGKLSNDELARLYCRRFGYCDTNIFSVMGAKEEFGNFPKLKPLNEDNLVADLSKFRRKAFKRNEAETTMNSPPFWRVFCDGYGGQNSLGGESHEGAVGAYLFVCSSTGSTDIRLYASHKQFPIALHQFLVRVQAEFWCCRVIFVDTHSVNISSDVEEVLALFQVQLVPVSASSPQEMAFAESRVRVIKRMSTAMLTGAPHLGKEHWALADKYAVFVSDFLPQQSRNNLCSYYLRTGRHVDWKLISVKVFGAPLLFSRPLGPIHKRAPIAEEGYFMGIQWPAALVMRKSDGKILNVSRQKIRVHESAYTAPLAKRIETEEVKASLKKTAVDSGDTEPEAEMDEEIVMKPESTCNTVQSIKSLRDHKLPMIGTSNRQATEIEESASFGNVDPAPEGIYVDSVLDSDVDQLAKKIAEGSKNGISIRDSILKALRSSDKVVKKGNLAKGKNQSIRGQISPKDNRYEGFDSYNEKLQTATHIDDSFMESDQSEISGSSGSLVNQNIPKRHLRSRKVKEVEVNIGTRISVDPVIFDVTPGAYSRCNPDRVYGRVDGFNQQGKVIVVWDDDGSESEVRLKDIVVEDSEVGTHGVSTLLVEGEKVTVDPTKHMPNPKDFFEALVRPDWRKWVEAVKKEIQGWKDNNAVEVVQIDTLPVTAKVVPLGELYTIKRSGTYKYREYLMGNLLRPGVDFQYNYSTTISSTGITVFYAMAVSSRQQVHGWDAVCGYLQTKEQFDVYAYLPSHAGYSNLEYEEIAELRKSFRKIYETDGVKGIRKFSRNQKKEYRANPKEVYKCNASIYGNPSAGMEFEKLMNSVHTQTAGMTQTQPEPSMYVKIKVDDNDKVVGYLVAIAFVDDVRFFGTEPEVKEYCQHVTSRLKVKFEEPPIAEFVSIETYQNLDEGTFELKMPKYFQKAATFFKEFVKGGFKERTIPLTVADESIIAVAPSEEEIKAAKHLPFLQAVGILSYPASNCKFEMRYAVSVIGSRRTGWSEKHFQIVVKLFEYALTTADIGLIFSNGLDPHGTNVLYAYADASHKVPRPQGCRIVMMNGAALSFVSKKQTMTAPSTCWAELVTQFDCSTDVLGLRNLLAELGHFQEYPTVIYQDNKSAIQISNNRGSLGKASRAMDLKTLSIRNRIEDHLVATEYVETNNMVADMGSKALPEKPFVRFRDTMNGYALVRAKFPNKVMSPHIFQLMEGPLRGSGESSKLQKIQAMIMSMKFQPTDEFDGDIEYEEEEDDDDIQEREMEHAFCFNIGHGVYTPLEMMDCHDLPDSRLYDVDIIKLRKWTQRYVDGNRDESPYDSYYHYMRHIEPSTFRDCQERHTTSIVANHGLEFMRFFPAVLSLAPAKRSSQIHRALYLFVEWLITSINSCTHDEITDNVYWTILNRSPSPKISWLKWLRWRKYCWNLQQQVQQHQRRLDLGSMVEYGPANLRTEDIARMDTTTCIVLDSEHGQYQLVNFEASLFTDNTKKSGHGSFVLEECKLWTLHQLEPHDNIKYVDECKTSQLVVRGARAQRVHDYLESRCPKWGRNPYHHDDVYMDHGWGDANDAVQSNNGWGGTDLQHGFTNGDMEKNNNCASECVVDARPKKFRKLMCNIDDAMDGTWQIGCKSVEKLCHDPDHDMQQKVGSMGTDNIHNVNAHTQVQEGAGDIDEDMNSMEGNLH